MGVILGICLRQRAEPWSPREKVENHFDLSKLKSYKKINCKCFKSQATKEILIVAVNASLFLKMPFKVAN